MGVRGPLVLCYHGVSEGTDHELLIKPSQLIRHVTGHLRRGFRAGTAAEVLHGQGRLLHVTFDDAFCSVFSVLDDLERLGVPVTVFAATELADSGFLDVPEVATAAERHPSEFTVMGWDDLRRLGARGVEVGSHTCSHPRLTSLSDADLDRELRESKRRIEAELGRPCPLLAYPYGDEDPRVHQAARRAGYAAAFALRSRHREFDLHAVPRVDLYRQHTALGALLRTSGPARRR